ncbi:hypothetical protein ACSBR2_031378 [Camellia fascicularis]
MNRWLAIQLATNKFCGCFAQIRKLNQSGLTEKDKKLYKELYKSSFPFEHCWNELRDQPKWRKKYNLKKQKTNKAVTPDICSPIMNSINLDNNDASNDNYVDLERPLGRKAEKDRLNKKKSKDRGNDQRGSPIMILLEELKEDKNKMSEKKIEMYERSYLQEQKKIDNEKERIQNEKEKMQMEQLKKEERIMSTDTSGILPLQAEYIHHRQMEILRKRI